MSNIFSAREDAIRASMVGNGSVAGAAPSRLPTSQMEDEPHGGGSCGGCIGDSPCSGCGGTYVKDSPSQQALKWGANAAQGVQDPFWRLATIAQTVRDAPASDGSPEWTGMDHALRGFQAMQMVSTQGANAASAVTDWFFSPDGSGGGGHVDGSGEPDVRHAIWANPATGDTRQDRQFTCCCSVVRLEIATDDFPISELNDSKKISRISVKVYLAWQESDTFARCEMEWNEWADNVQGYPLLTEPNTWRDVYNTKGGFQSAPFVKWNEAMGYKKNRETDKDKADWKGYKFGSADFEPGWGCPSGEQAPTVTDQPFGPSGKTPGGASNSGIARVLNGYVRVYSGCPDGKVAEGSWQQVITADENPPKPPKSYGGPPYTRPKAENGGFPRPFPAPPAARPARNNKSGGVK